MIHWVRFNFQPSDGRYLCYCNDIVSSWCEVLTMRDGVWLEHSGREFEPVVTHWMPLPEPPKDGE